jgi:predicted small lipoprotein YifL
MLCEKPHQLRWHCAEECAGAGEGLGEAAPKTAKVGLIAGTSLQFHASSALASLGQCLYGAVRIGDFDVTSDLGRTSGGWAVIVLMVAALSLGACGRKGGLDLPPTAYSPTASAVSEPSDGEAQTANKSTAADSSSDAAPTAPKGKKRPFILDPLLGN